MRWWNDYRMRLMLVGVVVAIVAGGRSAKADFTFGEPTNLGPTINTSSSESAVCLSADGLEMYISTGLDVGDSDIWVTRRATTDDSWGSPVNLGPPVNSLQHEPTADISPDGKTLYFS